MSRAEILKAALDLPIEEREQLVDDLWASLNGEPDDAVEEAWAREIERRLDEADAGDVQRAPRADVRNEALEALRHVRGR